MELHESVTDSRAITAYNILEATLTTKHKGKYTYEESIYKTARTAFKVTCPAHGNWEVTPDNHRRGTGCPLCDKSNKIDTTEFIRRVKLKHGDKFSYDNTVYTSTHSRVVVTCKVHGDYKQRPNDHMSGKGCPKCAREAQRVSYNGKYFIGKKTVLYYLEVVPGVYKVGITSNQGVRFKALRPYKIVYKVTYEDGADAYKVEQEILNKINCTGVLDILPIKLPGYTEMSVKPFLLDFINTVKSSNFMHVSFTPNATLIKG